MKNLKTLPFLIVTVMLWSCASTPAQPKLRTINVNLSQQADISTCEGVSFREIDLTNKDGIKTILRLRLSFTIR